MLSTNIYALMRGCHETGLCIRLSLYLLDLLRLLRLVLWVGSVSVGRGGGCMLCMLSYSDLL